MRKYKQGQDGLTNNNLAGTPDINGSSDWWGDTYRMVKEGYRYFWLKGLPKLFYKQHGIRLKGIDTHGEWHPEVRTLWTLKKMEALGNYKRIEKIKAASVLRKQLNDETI